MKHKKNIFWNHHLNYNQHLPHPEPNIFAPWKWMVGIRSFPLGAKGLFSSALAVSFRECNQWLIWANYNISPTADCPEIFEISLTFHHQFGGNPSCEVAIIWPGSVLIAKFQTLRASRPPNMKTFTVIRRVTLNHRPFKKSGCNAKIHRFNIHQSINPSTLSCLVELLPSKCIQKMRHYRHFFCKSNHSNISGLGSYMQTRTTCPTCSPKLKEVPLVLLWGEKISWQNLAKWLQS